MDCAKGTAVAGLYDDLMVEILSRVPVKDVRRSKCVSKPWRDLIADPLHRKLMTVPASSGSCPLPPPLEESYDDNGKGRYAHTFLMFDPAVSSHFSLVQFWENSLMGEVETVRSYSSETRVWIDRSSKWKRGEKGGEWGLWGKAMIKLTFGRALVNGLLHFIVYHLQKEEALIVAVDGEGKVCRIISWHDKHESADASYIGQSQGHLHCISVNLQLQGFRIYCTQVSVWVLEDYDTHEWILKHNVNPSQVFGLLKCPIHDFDIVAIHPDHNSMILVQHWNQKLVSYDMDSKELRALCTLGEGYQFITPFVPCFMESPVLATKD